MKLHRLLGLAAVLAGLAVTGWLGWRWHTTPQPPDLPLDGMEEPVAAAVRGRLEEVRRAPRSAEAWGKLGFVLQANWYPVPAQVCFAHAQDLDPQDPRWPYLRADRLLGENRASALSLLRRALTLSRSPEQRGTVLYRLAQTLLEEGRLDEAERDLRALAEIAPDDERVHFGLGLLAVARNQEAVTREHLTRVTDSPFARKRANSLLAALAGDDGESARAYQRRAAQLPLDLAWPDPFLLEFDDYEVGISRRLESAKQLDAQGRHAEALSQLRRLAGESPHAEVYHALGLTLMRLGQLDEAEEVLRTTVRLNPRTAQAHALLGTVLLLQGDKRSREAGGDGPAAELFRQAVAAEDEALALNPEYPQGHLIRGRALKRLGRTDEALQALRQALLCGPEFAEVHLDLGETLAETGNVREGLGHLADAVRLAEPNDPGPREALAKWRARAGAGSP
jgi:tetratricopeptide (TPR) repeat protein